MNSLQKKKCVMYILAVVIVLFFVSVNGDSAEPIMFTSDDGFLVQHAGEIPEDIYTKTLILEKGTYHINMAYTSSESGNALCIMNHGMETERMEIPAGEGELNCDLYIDEATPDLAVSVYYAGAGYLEVKSFGLMTDQPWHHDNWVRAALMLVAAIVIFLLVYLSGQEKITKQVSLELYIILGIALLSSSFLLNKNCVGHGDDLTYHLTRIEGIAQGLRDGQFPVMIYPDMLSGNGYLNAMYPSLFLYIPAVFRLMGVSYVVAYKLFLILVNFATAFAMYYSVKCLAKSGRAAVLGTAIYVFAQYRLNNMLVRGALGETLAMIFLPLVIAGVWQIAAGNRKKWWILVIGATGVIQSHVLSMVVYAVIAAILVCTYAGKIMKDKRYAELGMAVGWILLLNIGFLVPFLVYYVKGNLNLGELTSTFAYWVESLNPAYMLGIFRITRDDTGFVRDFSLHFPILCLLGLSLIYLCCNRSDKTDRSDRDLFLRRLFVLSCLLLFMCTNWFPYEKIKDIAILDKFFSMLQFPWRFEGPAIGMIAMVGPVLLVEFRNFEKYANTIIIVLMALVVLDASHWNLQWNQSMTDSMADEDRTCADIIYCPGEYMVKGDGTCLNGYIVSDKQIAVEQYAKDKLRIDIVYRQETGEHWIDLPLMNYIGYSVKDEAGQNCTVMTGDAGNIRVMTDKGGVHEIHVKYKEPVYFRIAELVSVLSLLAGIAAVLRKRIDGRLLNGPRADARKGYKYEKVS